VIDTMAPSWFPTDFVEDDGEHYWMATSGGFLSGLKPVYGIVGTWKLLFVSAQAAATFYDDQPSVQSIGQIELATALSHVDQYNREFPSAERCQGVAVVVFDGVEWFARRVVRK